MGGRQSRPLVLSNVTKSIFNRLSSFKPFNKSHTCISHNIETEFRYHLNFVQNHTFSFIPLRFQLFSLKTSMPILIHLLLITIVSYAILFQPFIIVQTIKQIYTLVSSILSQRNFDSIYTFFRVTVLVSNRHRFQLLIII